MFLLLCVMTSETILPTRRRKRKRTHYFSTTCTQCQWPRGRVLQEHCTTVKRRQHHRLSRSSWNAHQLVSYLTEISVCVYACSACVRAYARVRACVRVCVRACVRAYNAFVWLASFVGVTTRMSKLHGYVN